MRRLLSVLLIQVLLLTLAGCSFSEEPYEEDFSDVSKEYESVQEHYSGDIVEPEYHTSKVFPYISFIIPHGYEIIEEKIMPARSSLGIWRAVLYNSQKDLTIVISYIDWRDTEDGSWDEVFSWLVGDGETYVLPPVVGDTEGYTIYGYEDNGFLVLPKDWQNVVGSISVDYNGYFMNGTVVSIDNGDVQATLELALSITPSELTHQEYESLQ